MTIKEIEKLIEEGESLKAIAQAYSEIANLKIKRIRSEVERNRVFFAEISKVYGLVKILGNKRKVAVAKPKKRVCCADNIFSNAFGCNFYIIKNPWLRPGVYKIL